MDPSHSFEVNVLIWQIHNTSCSFLYSKLFYKSNCGHSLLQAWLLEKLLSPKSCSFGGFSLALGFYRNTVVYRNSYCQEDLFEASVFFCKGNILFKRPFGFVHSIKQCVISFEKRRCGRPFILSNVLASFWGSAWAIHSLMWRDLFHAIDAAIQFFQDWYGTDYFWRQLLTKNNYFFWKSYFRHSVFLRIVYLFHY